MKEPQPQHQTADDTLNAVKLSLQFDWCTDLEFRPGDHDAGGPGFGFGLKMETGVKGAAVPTSMYASLRSM